jgi:hypothetical protein
MNKREYCESRESIAYYSGLNGLEIKGIEYGINDHVYCVSGCWYGGESVYLILLLLLLPFQILIEILKLNK